MKATAEQRRWEETRRERQDGRATEERGYTGVYPRIHSPIVRLFPSSEWPNRIESNHPAWTMKTNYALLVYVRARMKKVEVKKKEKDSRHSRKKKKRRAFLSLSPVNSSVFRALALAHPR